MGKVSDALDRIESRREIGLIDPPPPKKKTDASISAKAESIIRIEKYGNRALENGKWDDRLFKAAHDNSKIGEAFSALSSTILHPPDGRTPPRSIMVASSTAKEGKSFVSANLGISCSQNFHQPCLLVDCNFHHSTLAHDFGIDSKVGLVDFIRDQVDLSGLVKETSVSNLLVLPMGIVPDKPAELLGSSRMNVLVDNISRRFNDHTIVYDSPSILQANESIALAGLVDAVVLVVRQGQAKKGEVQRSIEAINEEKILGIVFNDILS